MLMFPPFFRSFSCLLTLPLLHRLLVLLRCFSIFEAGLRDGERSSLQRKSHERDYRADGSKRMYIVTFREAYSRVCISRTLSQSFIVVSHAVCHIVAVQRTGRSAAPNAQITSAGIKRALCVFRRNIRPPQIISVFCSCRVDRSRATRSSFRGIFREQSRSIEAFATQKNILSAVSAQVWRSQQHAQNLLDQTARPARFVAVINILLTEYYFRTLQNILGSPKEVT